MIPSSIFQRSSGEGLGVYVSHSPDLELPCSNFALVIYSEIRALDSGFALNFRLKNLIDPKINSRIRPILASTAPHFEIPGYVHVYTSFTAWGSVLSFDPHV